jgi:hypothetical protein
MIRNGAITDRQHGGDVYDKNFSTYLNGNGQCARLVLTVALNDFILKM